MARGRYSPPIFIVFLRPPPPSREVTNVDLYMLCPWSPGKGDRGPAAVGVGHPGIPKAVPVAFRLFSLSFRSSEAAGGPRSAFRSDPRCRHPWGLRPSSASPSLLPPVGWRHLIDYKIEQRVTVSLTKFWCLRCG